MSDVTDVAAQGVTEFNLGAFFSGIAPPMGIDDYEPSPETDQEMTARVEREAAVMRKYVLWWAEPRAWPGATPSAEWASYYPWRASLLSAAECRA